MIKLPLLLLSILMVSACNSTDDSSLSRSERRVLETRAAANTDCVFEDQFACAHIVENRTTLSLFFAPKGIGKMDDAEKARGQRITTKYVVGAASGIKQCSRTSDKAILLLKQLTIADEPFQVFGTAPLSDQSKCYITREAL